MPSRQFCTTIVMVSRAPARRRILCCVALAVCTVAGATAITIVSRARWRTSACCDYHHGDSQRPTSMPRRGNYVQSQTLSSLSMMISLEKQRHRAIATAFRPRMSDGEKAAALLCLRAFDAALRNANVTYLLYGGTLLGARRHRGIVPWDDDIDVLANYTQLSDLEKALRSVAGYELYAAHPNRYKFYARTGAPIRGKTWRWPYVDVCFFGENATHVYDNFPGLSDSFCYAKVDVFPLAYRSFDDLLLPSPTNEERVLARNYDEHTCQSNKFSHRDEAELSRTEWMSVPCTELHSMYPFIFRNCTTPKIKEILKVGDKIVGYFGTNDTTLEMDCLSTV